MTITSRTQSSTQVQRDSWVEINLSGLERNFKQLKELLKTNIMAVVKADAYGHGAPLITQILQGMKVASFGVATVDEGISLRNSGINVPIIILGATPFWTYNSCLVHQLTITVHSIYQINQLEEFCKNLNCKLTIHLKIDTGMHRLGIEPEAAKDVIENLLDSKYLMLDGIYTHLSDAKNYGFSKLQKEKFDNVLNEFKDLKITKHIANSFSAINYPEFRYDLVRLGIALYGHEFNFLDPIISLKGRITDIRKIKQGEYVSYDRTWQAQNESLIATIPIGYADGVDGNLSNKIYAIYNEKKIKQVGNITMDQMMFDITKINSPKIGDIITMLDNENSISNWAKILSTTTYELLCRLKMRLPRVYTRD